MQIMPLNIRAVRKFYTRQYLINHGPHN